jgi:hypothetical protein
MRNIIVALGSFIVGAISMSLVGNHTSTLAQVPTAVRAQGTVPVVPPFRSIVVNGYVFDGKIFAVDGILCTRCTFKNATLEYGGGAFAILEPRLSGSLSIKLDGAAHNTAVFLNMFGLLGCQTKNVPKVNPDPIMRAKYIPEGNLEIRSR